MRLIIILACCLLLPLAAAERINHEGRILGPAPTVAGPTLFNTAQADAVLAAMQIMPTDSPWNEDVSGLPLLNNSPTDSTDMIIRINSPLTAANRKLRVFQEMNFVLVPDGQANVPITFTTYPGESDPSPYPIPTNQPIETWPTGTGSQTLTQWQQSAAGGDRHGIMVKPTAGFLWETWQMRLVGSAWQASNGALFNLNSNTLRTDGFTSGDAAGLPMFPALIRYDEVQRGKIEHAMRLVVKQTRNVHIYPATHHTTGFTDAEVPAMGQRLRLKASFTIDPTWSNESKIVAAALKKYGCLVADNSSQYFSISATPDNRWPVGCFDDLLDIAPTDFEVVESTDATEGPRSTLTPKPTANAGADQSTILGTPITLAGSATGTATTLTWSVYPGAPGTVTFSNANSATSTANFSALGVYTLLLKVADATHVPAYDAMIVTVTSIGVAPVPTLSLLSPSSAVAGSAGFTMTLTGANFIAGASVWWAGQASLTPNPATLTSTQLTVTVPASYLATGGVPAVSVANPGPNVSSSIGFVISDLASGGGGGGGSGGGAAGGGGCGAGGAGTAAAVLLLGMLFMRRLR